MAGIARSGNGMPDPEQGIEPGDAAMSLNPDSRGVLGRIVLVCGTITAGAGTLILVGWTIGSDARTAMGTGYIPAPNTALLFVLMGSAVLVREAWPASRVIHRIAAAAAIFSAVMGSVTLIGFVIGLNIDDWLFSTMRMLGEVPMGHMSPVTAFCFVLAGGSLLLLECQARTWAAISGTLITLAGAACLMGYWFGAPLLYGGTVIPVALPTSLALVALGAGLTAAAGPDTWPLNTLIGPSTRARLLRALLPTVVLLALIKDWITAVLLEHSDPGVVLASAMTAVSFLVVVGLVVSRVSRTIGDAIDRTEAELTHAAEALRESEETLHETLQRLKFHVENSPLAVVEFDREFRVISWSNVAQRVFGWSAEEILGKRIDQLRWVHEEDAARVAALSADMFAGRRTRNLHTNRNYRKDGSVITCEWYNSALLDSAGDLVSVLSLVVDITERKHAEDALRNRESLLQRIFDLLPVGLWFADKDGKLLRGNPAGVKIWGAEPQVGLSGYGIFKARRLPSGEEVAADDWALAHTIRDKVTIVDELLEIDAFDGKKKTILNYTAPVLDAEGEVQGAIVVNQDITESKRIEQALHDNAKRLRNLSRRLIAVEETERRKINRELHDRVGAHLSALNLNLSIVRSQLPQESLRAVGVRLEDTQKLLEETTARVRDLMADLHPPALDDYGLLAALRTYAESLGARIAVPISVHGEPFVPRLPLAAETALFRVAQGALVNAVTHAQAKRIEILVAATADRATLTIADDGLGFDAAHTSMTHASWGLAIMCERAEAVGAELTVESAPGKGTRVRVEIPRK